MEPYSLFINYPVGARGNFLGTILQNNIQLEYFKEFDLAECCRGYYKLHHLSHDLAYATKERTNFRIGREIVKDFDSLFSGIKKQKLYSVRILPQTFDGIINLSILGLSKNTGIDEFDQWQLHGMCKATIDELNEDLAYRTWYDQIVYFEDLFNVNKINEIYNNATGNLLTSTDLDTIEYNIVLQQKVINSIREQEKFQSIFHLVENMFNDINPS